MAFRRLLMVDGTGHLYRSFFAIKSLSRHDGTPTNAVFGFVRAIHQLQQVWQPTHLVVAWDGGAPKERLERLPSYKAQRPPMPEPLRGQIPLVMEFLGHAAIPVIRQDHEEADDIIASLTQWALGDAADEVLIASSDKDMFQLVTDRVSLIPAAKEAPKLGRDAVYEKTGVYPEQIVDWLALTGDTVDNIPGVPGLGPKTATKLLAQFGSLESLWTRLDEVSSAGLRQKLFDSRRLVDNNVHLVRLRRDLACSPGWDAMEVKAECPDRLRPFYEHMEFHSLLKNLDQPTLL